MPTHEVPYQCVVGKAGAFARGEIFPITCPKLKLTHWNLEVIPKFGVLLLSQKFPFLITLLRRIVTVYKAAPSHISNSPLSGFLRSSDPRRLRH